MENNRLEKLLAQIQNLEREQMRLKANIDLVKQEAKRLQEEEVKPIEIEPKSDTTSPDISITEVQTPFVYEPQESTEKAKSQEPFEREIPVENLTNSPTPQGAVKAVNSNKNLEKFLGENLANKVGIAVLILGAGIFAKYAIEHNWITPVMRIALGYLLALAVFVIAIRTRPTYEKFSAVLMAGSFCIAYLISYFAFSLYELYPRWLAFLLLLLFTGVSVKSALSYRSQVMAIISLVGAYAVPFLLSNNSGRVEYLFTYMAVINLGSLFLCMRQKWLTLWNSGLVFTWLIYSVWFISESLDSHFQREIAFLFLIIHFLTYFLGLYAILSQTGDSQKRNYLLQLGFLSFALFVYGNMILGRPVDFYPQVIFAFLASGFYLGMYGYALRQKKHDGYYTELVLSIGLIFLTGAVSIALDNEFKTAMWAVESLLLSYIGIKHNHRLTRRSSFVVAILTAASLAIDLSNYYDHLQPEFLSPFWNPIFGLNLFVMVLLFANTFLQKTKPYELVEGEINTYGLSVLTLTVLTYLTFLIELLGLLRHLNFENEWVPRWYQTISTTSMWAYSVIFVAISQQIFNQSHKREMFAKVYAGLVLLFSALYVMFVLTSQIAAIPFKFFGFDTSELITLNTLSILPMILLWWIGNRLREVYQALAPSFFVIASRIYLIVFLSFQLNLYLKLGYLADQNKVAMSILWGAFALFQIVDGVRKKRSEFRWIGLILLALTLFKLFLFDLAQLSTISKTISLICLGIFLLLVSYLYNRFKDLLEGKEE